MKTHREKEDELLLSTSLREFLLKIRGNLVGIGGVFGAFF